MTEEWTPSTTKLARELGVGRRTLQGWRAKYQDCPSKGVDGAESVTKWEAWLKLHPELRVSQRAEDEIEPLATAPLRFEGASEGSTLADYRPGLEGSISRLHAIELLLYQRIEDAINGKGKVSIGPWLEVIEQIRRQEKDLTEIMERQGRYVRVGDIAELEARRMERFRAVALAIAPRVASKVQGCDYTTIHRELEQEITAMLNTLAEIDFDQEEEITDEN